MTIPSVKIVWESSVKIVWHESASKLNTPEGENMLDVPTVGGRIAQSVVAVVLEPFLEPVFYADSYAVSK